MPVIRCETLCGSHADDGPPVVSVQNVTLHSTQLDSCDCSQAAYTHRYSTLTPINISDISPALACFNAHPPTASDGQEVHHFLPLAALWLYLPLLVFLHLTAFSQEAALRPSRLTFREDFPPVSMRAEVVLALSKNAVNIRHCRFQYETNGN